MPGDNRASVIYYILPANSFCCLVIGQQPVKESYVLCQLQDMTRLLTTSSFNVKPTPILRHLKSEHLIEHPLTDLNYM